jgi:branched-chain amino acid transport system ATP-binding protein
MLRVDGINTFYGKVRALEGVSLEVHSSEIVALIGANGAGKSTTLKTISGLLKPTRGSIEFLGEPIDKLSPDAVVRRGISLCPEGRRVWPEMTVWENLVLGAYSRRDRKGIDQALRNIYERFPILEERRDQLAGSLSGGEQQMLAIGRALMSKPKLLMLDEPSLGLAPMLVEDTFAIIRELNQEGITILLVEQNAFLALNMAHRAYVLETGQITLEGPGKELLLDRHVKEAYLGL